MIDDKLVATEILPTRRVQRARSASLRLSATQDRDLPGEPYRGIAPFRFIDEPIFFGREEESERLIRYVLMYRGVLFYGDSGTGKSSLINARFIPQVLDDGFCPDRIRLQPRVGAEIFIERISLRNAGGAPFLRSNFELPRALDERMVLSCADFETQVRSAAAKSTNSADGAKPLLIFEQFEEFVTLFEDAPENPTARDEARGAQSAVLECIVRLLEDRLLPVKLLFVFREDYLGKIEQLVFRRPELIDQRLRLLQPSVKILPRLLRRPLAFQSPAGDRPFRRKFSPALRAKLLRDLRARSKDGFANPTELQIACKQLWRAKDPDALFRGATIGAERIRVGPGLRTRLFPPSNPRTGVEGLLETYLMTALGTITDRRLHATAEMALCSLVTSGGTRNVISEPDLLEHLRADSKIKTARVTGALAALETTGLIRKENRHGVDYYEIVSEFLAPWIVEKKLLHKQLVKWRKWQRFVEYGALFGLLFVAIGFYYQNSSLRKARELAEKKTIEAVRAANEATIASAAAKENEESAKISAAQAKASATAKDAAAADLKTQLDDQVETTAAVTRQILELIAVVQKTNLRKGVQSSVESDIHKRLKDLRDMVQRDAAATVEKVEQITNPGTQPDGWAYAGTLDDVDKWGDRSFDNRSAPDVEQLPKVGDTLSAAVYVNLRSDSIPLDKTANDRSSERILGVLKPDDYVKILQVKQLTDADEDATRRLWVLAEKVPAPAIPRGVTQVWGKSNFRAGLVELTAPGEATLNDRRWPNSNASISRSIQSVVTGKGAWFIGFNKPNYEGSSIKIGPEQRVRDLKERGWANAIVSYRIYADKPSTWTQLPSTGPNSIKTVKEFLTAHHSANSRGDIPRLVADFAKTVRYMNNGTVDHAFIKKDLERYHTRHSQIKDTIVNSQPQIIQRADGEVLVTYMIRCVRASRGAPPSTTLNKISLHLIFRPNGPKITELHVIPQDG